MNLPDFPTKIFDFPVRKLLVYQRVNILSTNLIASKKTIPKW